MESDPPRKAIHKPKGEGDGSDSQKSAQKSKFVPKLLTEQRKELRKEISKHLLDLANHNPEFIKTIVIGDE